MQGAILIGWGDLFLSLALMAAVIGLDYGMKLALGKDLAIGTFRVFIQLYLVGFILKWIFAVNQWWMVVPALALMSVMAGYNAVKRAKTKTARNAAIATGVIVLATFVSAGFSCWVVIGVRPWFNPQYIIPIGGMAMNGAMNGVALGISNLRASVKDNVERIECSLSLGGNGAAAIHPLMQEAARRSMIPTVNSLMTAGIVQLPGMMTGQIIAGLDPTTAIRYQILIYYMLAIGTALSVLISMHIEARRYFTSAQQLKKRW